MRRRDVDDDDDVVRDGESVRVPLHLCDRVQRAVVFDGDAHRPHHAELTDEVRKLRAETRREYLANLQDAWRTPHRDAAEPDSSSPPVMRRHLEPDNAQARRDAAWASYRDRLSQAWCDPRSATAIERQGERWRGGR
jgi:hypothetical protein